VVTKYSENPAGDKEVSIVGKPQYRDDYYADWQPKYSQQQNPHVPPHITNRPPQSLKPPKADTRNWPDARSYVDTYYLTVELPYELHLLPDGRAVVLNRLSRPIWINVTPTPAADTPDGVVEPVWQPVGGPRDIHEEERPAVFELHPELDGSEYEFSIWRPDDRFLMGTDALIAGIEEQCRELGIPIQDPRPALLAEWQRSVSEAHKESPSPETRVARASHCIIDRKTPGCTAEAFTDTWLPNLTRREEEWMDWDGKAYRVVVPDELRRELIAFLRRCQHYVKPSKDAEPVLMPFEPTPFDVDSVTAMLKGILHVESEEPGWLPDRWVAVEPEPRDLLAVENGLLHLPSGIVRPATPAFFTRTGLDFAFDPKADQPTRWLRLLDEMWPEPDEKDNIEALQLWFGYLLTADTSQEKSLWMIGPPRSGKGTVLSAAVQMVGKRSVASPTMKQLSTRFGFEACLGKNLILVSDLTLDKRHTDTSELIGNLLRLTGQDDVDVDRKGKRALNAQRLRGRLMIASNGYPPLENSSGALANRLIFLRTYATFLGREDTTLKDAIHAERQGILNWAIEGFHKLRRRGSLLQPKSGVQEREMMEALSSPILTFLRDRATMDPQQWREAWRDDDGRSRVGNGFVDAHGQQHEGVTPKEDFCQAFRQWWSVQRGDAGCAWSDAYILSQLYTTPFGLRPSKRGPRGKQRPVLVGIELRRPLTQTETDEMVREATQKRLPL
jgi:P4 family phage/plasmid primase-like protien